MVKACFAFSCDKEMEGKEMRLKKVGEKKKDADGWAREIDYFILNNIALQNSVFFYYMTMSQKNKR